MVDVIVRMRVPRLILLLCCAVFVAQATEQTPPLDDPGVTNTKAFHPGGTVKFLTRRRLADGLLLSQEHYTTNGALIRVDDYDQAGRILRTLVKWQDGSAVEFWFDDQRRLWREMRFEPRSAVNVCDTRIFLLHGSVTLHPSQRWGGHGHKLNDSQDTVTFRVVGDKSTNAVLSVTAYDLSQPTNRPVFTQLAATAQHAATETSYLADWRIFVLNKRHGEAGVEVRDCFLDYAKHLGVHVRLAIPASLTLTKDQKNYMEQEFKNLLETVEVMGTK